MPRSARGRGEIVEPRLLQRSQCSEGGGKAVEDVVVIHQTRAETLNGVAAKLYVRDGVNQRGLLYSSSSPKGIFNEAPIRISQEVTANTK